MPGTIIEVVQTPTARGVTTTTDTAFMIGAAQTGVIDEPIELTSQADVQGKLGARLDDTPELWDAADLFFREGGTHMYVARRVGPAATLASHTFTSDTGSPSTSIRVDALYPGVWGNRISVAIEAGDTGGTFVLVVAFDDVEVERSSDLADKDAAHTWALNSDYIRVTALSGGDDPSVITATDLSGGDDDYANTTSDELEDALALFSGDLGPGQLVCPWNTDADEQALLVAHAAANNRIALLDATDTSTKATVIGDAAAIMAGADPWRAAMFAPGITVPGPLQGQERNVSPAALAAALMARNDVAGLPVTEPSANRTGDSISATGLSVTSWTDDDRDDLNTAGVDVFKDRRGTITLWGYRTLADPDTDLKEVELGASRLLMQLVALCDAAAEPFVLRRIDGKNHILAELRTALAGVLDPFAADGSLVFDTDAAGTAIPGTAYSIEVEADRANRELSAVLTLRIAGMAETVRVRIVRRASDEAL